QVLSNGNVFIFEYTGRRLTERTTEGKIVWEKTVPGTDLAYGAQRLANGNVFITTRTGLLEIDKDGTEVFSHKPAGATIYAARKARTGEMIYVTLEGKCVRLDKDGKETGSFDVGRITVTTGIDLLPNGNVLVPLYLQSKVVEFDKDGKQVWSANTDRPYGASR